MPTALGGFQWRYVKSPNEESPNEESPNEESTTLKSPTAKSPNIALARNYKKSEIRIGPRGGHYNSTYNEFTVREAASIAEKSCLANLTM